MTAIRSLILFLIAFFLASYLVGLSWSPAPLFEDESGVLSRALYWSSFGKTFEGVRWPVLIPLTGQFYAFPAYFYSVALWSKFFPGDVSFADLRALGSVFVAATAFLTFVFACQLRIPRLFAALASLFYISSPQALLSYRIAWDPIVMPFQVMLAIVGCEFFFNLIDRDKQSALRRCLWLYLGSASAAGCLSALLWYGYTAGRLIAILLLILFVSRILLRQELSLGFKFRSTLFFCVAFCITALPVGAAIYGDPLSLARTSQELNQFSLLGIYSSFKSLLTHTSYFDYLIFWGDPQRRHSTGFGGVIGFSGWILLICASLVIVRTNLNDYSVRKPVTSPSILSKPIGLIIAYILIATSPSALSFPEIHALRSSAAFPFWSILASIVLFRTQQRLFLSVDRFKKAGLCAASAAFLCGVFGLFALQYMLSDSSFLASAQQGSTYPGLSKEYFQNSAYLRFKSLSDQDLLERVSSMNLPISTEDSRILFEYLSRRLDSKSAVRPSFLID